MRQNMPSILPQNAAASGKIGPRRLRLLWMGVWALLLLTSACGGAGEAPSGSAPPPSPSPAPATASPAPPRQTAAPPPATATPAPAPSLPAGLTIPLWHTLPEAWLRGPLAQFNRENEWGLVVKPRAFPDEAALLAALPDAPPGVLVLGYPALTPLWPQGFSDLRPLMQAAPYGLPPEAQADIPAVFLQEGRVDGAQYALPLLRSAAFLVRNHSWAAELGYAPIPRDVAAFQQQACAANAAMKADNDVYNDGLGGWLVDTTPPVMLGWLYAFGAPLQREGGWAFDTPETESAFTFFKALFDENCAWVGSDPYPDAYLGARQALFAAATLSDLPYIEQAFAEAGNSDSWGALPFPAPQGEAALPTFGPSFALQAEASETQALAAWLVIRWMLRPEVQAQLVQQSGYLPVRRAAFPLLKSYGQQHTAWQSVAEALPYARPEPALPSWAQVQWVLQDAGAQVFRPYFTLERIPDTLQLLDETAHELAAP